MKYLLLLYIIYFVFGKPTTCFSQILPIKPTRTVSFTTDEGSYMNVDISPDGRTLLFDLLGDLYMVPATGGTATQLTRGIALNLNPIWSPDGKRIAYISDFSGSFHLNVKDVKGAFHRVFGKSDYAISPMWLPTGNFVYAGGFNYGLAGGKIEAKKAVEKPIRFTNDGQEVYYIDSGKVYTYNYSTKIKKIVISNSKILQDGSISPDGHWWAYYKDTLNFRRCLVARNLNNNTSKVLAIIVAEKNGRDNMGMSPLHFSYSFDSKSIYIGYGGKIHHINISNGKDTVIPFRAHAKVDLGPLNYHTFSVSNAPFKVKYARSASISPDGKHLVFAALDRIYIMNLPNGKPHILAKQPFSQFQPAFSPDGRSVAYVSWCDTSGGFIWSAPTSGGKPERLNAPPGLYQYPTWSPDGKFIAVIKDAEGSNPALLRDKVSPGAGLLQVVTINSGIIKSIADTVPCTPLAFSRDGQRIIYTPKYPSRSRELLHPVLVSTDLNGKDQHIIAVAGSQFLSHFQQKMISPDGRYLVYSGDEDLYLIPLDKQTGPAILYDEKNHPSGIKFAFGVDPCWKKGGKVLSWTYGNKFYEVNPDKIVIAAEKAIQKSDENEKSTDDYISVNISPDKVFNIDLAVPKFYAHGTIALKNATIITMQGRGVIEHGTIVISNGRFAEIGSIKNINIPKNAKVIDMSGRTIMPGLVDLHDHMRVPQNILPEQSWMFLANLAYGVTTARDPSLNFDSFCYKELLEDGQMTGPRLYTVGFPARIPDGMFECNNIEDACSLVRKRVLFGGTIIKQYDLPTRIQRQWLIIACREMGLNMTNEGDFDPILQLAMIKDGSSGIEHNPVWGDVYNDVISLYAHSGTYFTPTLQVTANPEAKEYFNHQYWQQSNEKLFRFTYGYPEGRPTANGPESREVIMNFQSADTTEKSFISSARIDARIRKAGGKVTLGSHGNDEGIGAHNELWALQMGGLTNMEALEAATILGARGLGIQKDVGSIEVGKIADLLILNKNPLDDIHNSREIKYVMKDGVLYDGDTLDEIWPVYKKCPEWKLKGKN